MIKPIMSSSGKGQKIIRSVEDIQESWNYAITNARGESQKIIVEEFIDFDYEITLLTVRHSKNTTFCPPIGHIQIDGDYRESWQFDLLSLGIPTIQFKVLWKQSLHSENLHIHTAFFFKLRDVLAFLVIQIRRHIIIHADSDS